MICLVERGLSKPGFGQARTLKGHPRSRPAQAHPDRGTVASLPQTSHMSLQHKKLQLESALSQPRQAYSWLLADYKR